MMAAQEGSESEELRLEAARNLARKRSKPLHQQDHQVLADWRSVSSSPSPRVPRGGITHVNLTKDEYLTNFWFALARATIVPIEGATFLTVQGGRFPTVGGAVKDKLLRRQCYVELSKLAMEYFAKKDSSGQSIAGLIFILRGNTGIGKSIFLYFFMQELAASGQTVVLQRRKHRTVAFTKQGAFQGPEDGSLIGFGDFLKDPNNWFLVDAVEPFIVNAKTLFVSLPDYNLCKEALKRPGHEQKWMPCWSLIDELIPAGKTIFHMSEEGIKSRCRKFGPTPRYVFENSLEANSEELRIAIDSCSLHNLQSLFASPSSALEHVSDRLTLVTVTEKYGQGPLRFASPAIQSKLVEKCQRQNDGLVQDFLINSQGSSTQAIRAFRGELIDSIKNHAHERLRKGGEFECLDLDTDEAFICELPAFTGFTELLNHEAIIDLGEDVYGQGKNNLGAIDAVLNKRLFHMIVSQQHYIIARDLWNVVEAAGGSEGLELYFVVRSYFFTSDLERRVPVMVKTEDFTEAQYDEIKNIPQYLLLITPSEPDDELDTDFTDIE